MAGTIWELLVFVQAFGYLLYSARVQSSYSIVNFRNDACA